MQRCKSRLQLHTRTRPATRGTQLWLDCDIHTTAVMLRDETDGVKVLVEPKSHALSQPWASDTGSRGRAMLVLGGAQRRAAPVPGGARRKFLGAHDAGSRGHAAPVPRGARRQFRGVLNVNSEKRAAPVPGGRAAPVPGSAPRPFPGARRAESRGAAPVPGSARRWFPKGARCRFPHVTIPPNKPHLQQRRGAFLRWQRVPQGAAVRCARHGGLQLRQTDELRSCERFTPMDIIKVESSETV